MSPETAADQNDARLQRTEEGHLDQFITFDVHMPAKDGATKVLASRKHWKEVDRNDGENILWDRSNKRGIVPISQQAKQVARHLSQILPDALGEFAQIDPLVDIPKNEIQKIYSHVWEPKSDKGSSVDAQSNVQLSAQRPLRNSKMTRLPTMREVFMREAKLDIDKFTRTGTQNDKMKKFGQQHSNNSPHSGDHGLDAQEVPQDNISDAALDALKQWITHPNPEIKGLSSDLNTWRFFLPMEDQSPQDMVWAVDSKGHWVNTGEDDGGDVTWYECDPPKIR
jgi:hypothetical protein